jgi:hypothetical protein
MQTTLGWDVPEIISPQPLALGVHYFNNTSTLEFGPSKNTPKKTKNPNREAWAQFSNTTKSAFYKV